MTDDAAPDRDWEDYESGPFCEHWSTPGSCSECALGIFEVREKVRVLEARITALRETLELYACGGGADDTPGRKAFAALHADDEAAKRKLIR
jgi:hypothetical protein